MIITKKINLLTGTEEEMAVYSLDSVEKALICFLESSVNNNYDTWTYEKSEFKNGMRFNKTGSICYYMIDDNIGYSAKHV